MLTDKAAKAAQPRDKAYKIHDGEGLYLKVMPNGTKYWRLRISINGKETQRGLGVYPKVGLSEARRKRDETKSAIPTKRNRPLVSTGNFEALACEWHEIRKPLWKPHHAENVMKTLRRDVFPEIGKLAPEEIDIQDILAVGRKVEARGALDVLRDVLGYCSQIFQYGAIIGRVRMNPAQGLSRAFKSKPVVHRASMKEAELPAYLKKLNTYDGDGGDLTKYALKLVLLLFIRTDELRYGRWNEINWEKGEWRIPSERMKMPGEHIVPLATQSIKLMRKLQKASGGYEVMFPNLQRPDGVMSENTMLFALYRLGYKSKATVHGFRSTASTILNECGLFKGEAVERQLAHMERDEVRAAYNNAEYLPERRKMMQWWGDYLEEKGLCP